MFRNQSSFCDLRQIVYAKKTRVLMSKTKSANKKRMKIEESPYHHVNNIVTMGESY